MTWAEEELSRADLGDKRRNKRLIKIVSDLVEQPNESVTQASRDNAAMQGLQKTMTKMDRLGLLRPYFSRLFQFNCIKLGAKQSFITIKSLDSNL